MTLFGLTRRAHLGAEYSKAKHNSLAIEPRAS